MTKTLVGELLKSLKNNDSEEKIISIIERLEKLEEDAKKIVIEAEKFERAEKYTSMNHQIHIGDKRYMVKSIQVMVSPDTYKTILVPVEQRTCCIANQGVGFCCPSNRCDICPYRPGNPIPFGDQLGDKIVPLEPMGAQLGDKFVPQMVDSIELPALESEETKDVRSLEIGSSAPINLNRNKKPCEGCDCGRAKNISMDIEEIVKK